MEDYPKIYLDEAGYTGEDFLNPDQKVFVLTSNSFTTEESKIIFNHFNPKPEFHFQKLYRSSSGQKEILSLLNHELVSDYKIMSFVAHKEFALVGHIIDRLVEPVLQDKNINIYEDNLNIKLTNLLFLEASYFWPINEYHSFLRLFLIFYKSKDRESFQNFYDFLKKAHLNTKSKPINSIISLLYESCMFITNILEGFDKYSLELANSAYFVIIEYWTLIFGKEFSVIMDSSKPHSHLEPFIVRLTNLDLKKTRAGFGEKKLTFPLQLKKTIQTSSENYLQIQISDIISSSLAFTFNNTNPRYQSFIKDIKYSKAFNLSNNYTLWPGDTSLNPARKNDQSISDFLNKIL